MILSAIVLQVTMTLQPPPPERRIDPHKGYVTLQGGDGADEYWAFLPDQPRPVEAPVVVFLHGWGGMDPYVYGAWIKHLVQRGNIVIYPRYQTNIKTRFEEMTPGAMRALQSAYSRLRAEGPVRPSNNKLSFVGHSMGGFVATNLAATAEANGLPVPSALMVITPGDGEGRMRRLGWQLPLVDMNSAPSSLAVLLVTGDKDTVVGDGPAIKIWEAIVRSSIANKTFVTLETVQGRSDSLPADHLSPLATDPSFDPSFTINPSGKSNESRGWLARRKEARRQRLIARTRDRWADRYEPDALDVDGLWKLFDEFLEVTSEMTSPESRKVRVGRWFAQLGEGARPGAPTFKRRDDIMRSVPD